MQTPLDSKAEDAKKIVAKALMEGKSVEDIVELLKKELGIDTNQNAVMFFIRQHFGRKVEDASDRKRDVPGRVDVLKEMISLYYLQKERLETLRRFEKEVSMPLPEVRENIALLLAILVRIGSILGTQSVSVEDRKRWLLEDVEPKE